MTACLSFCCSVAVSCCSPLRGDTLFFFACLAMIEGDIFCSGQHIFFVRSRRCLCRNKPEDVHVVVRGSYRDDMECGWKDVFQSVFHVCQHRQLSEWVCDTHGTCRRVNRKPHPAKVMFVTESVWRCCAQFFRAQTSLLLHVVL